MIREFKGRIVVGGVVTAPALVTHGGFNTLASLKTASGPTNKEAICEDQNNPDLYKKSLNGVALCLPETIGSTTGGMVIYSVGSLGRGPKCMLFSKRADTLAISGAVLLAKWSDHPIVMIDELGQEFLDYVKDNMSISVSRDGTVTVVD